MYVFMYVCMHACTHVCMYVYIHTDRYEDYGWISTFEIGIVELGFSFYEQKA